MLCPNCQHSRNHKLFACAHCQQVFPASEVESLNQLEFLLTWLEGQRLKVDVATFEHLRTEATQQHAVLKTALLKHVAVEPAPKPEPTAVAAPTQVEAPPPAPAITKPVVPPPPPPPPFNWKEAWQKAVDLVASGLLLRGLLYLGAFMVLAAALVLVIAFWNAFPVPVQVGFIAAVPLAFYVGGFLLRERAKIPQAGMVFTGMGALLVAVDFAAIYQLFSLSVDPALYWLVAALVCTGIYAFTAWRLPTEFYGYLTLLAATNVPVALSVYLRAQPAWWVAAVAWAALGMVTLVFGLARLPARWIELVQAAQRLPQLLLIGSFGVGFILFIQSSYQASAALLFNNLAVMVGFGLLSLLSKKNWHVDLAALASMAVGGLTLRTLNLPLEQYATAGALIAPLYYGLLGRWLCAPRTDESNLRRRYRRAAYLLGFGVLGLATVLGLLTFSLNRQASLLALTLLTLNWAVTVALFREAVLVWITGLVLIAPFEVALNLAGVSLSIQALATVALALGGYLPVGLLLRHARWGDEARRMAFAHPLAFIGFGLGAITFALTPLTTTPELLLAHGLFLVLLAVSLAYGFARPLFAWALTLTLPMVVWEVLLKVGVTWEAFAVVAVVFSTLYMFGERWTLKKNGVWREFHRPFGLGAVLLAGLAFTYTVPATLVRVNGVLNVWATQALRSSANWTMAGQAFLALQTILAARLYRSRWPIYLTPWLVTLVASVMLADYGAQWFGRALFSSEYAVLWVTLGIGFALAAFALDRAKVRYAHGLYFGGYALVAIASLWSAIDERVNVLVFGLALLVALASHALAYFSLHHTLEDFLRTIWGARESGLHRAGRTVFFGVVCLGFPLWLLQWLNFNRYDISISGLALILTAIGYAAIETALRFDAPVRRQRMFLGAPLFGLNPILLVVGTTLALSANAIAAVWVNGLAAVLMAALAVLNRRARGLYPALLAAHLALFAYLTTLPAGEPRFAALPFHALTWVVALIGLALTKRTPNALQHLLTPTWAQPFLLVAMLDISVWQLTAFGGLDTTFILTLGHAALLALAATWWRSEPVAFGSVGFALLGAVTAVAWWEVPLANATVIFGLLAFALYLLGWLAEVLKARVWIRALNWVGLGLSGLVVLLALGVSMREPSLAALALGVVGLTQLTAAYRWRSYGLGYLGVGVLLAAWCLLLIAWDVSQPQFYAAPAGLYLIGIAVLERQRDHKKLAGLVEGLGLAVILLTTFIQSLLDTQALIYVVILLAEGLLAGYWGAARRVKMPFFIGAGAVALNVLAQMAVAFAGGSTLARWLIIGSVGLLLSALAVLVERQRTVLLTRAQAFIGQLETWE